MRTMQQLHNLVQHARSSAGQKAQPLFGSRRPIRLSRDRIGRNAPCPCGSGRKFKQCHGRRQQVTAEPATGATLTSSTREG